MKIAFISVDDPRDYRSWSGLKLHILNVLKSIGSEVVIMPVVPWYFKALFKIKRNFYKILGIKYDSERSVILSKMYSVILEKELKKINAELIFTCDAYSVSFLKTNLPIYIWTDATFNSYYSHYFNNQKIHSKTIREGNLLDKRAFKKAKKIFLTSQWAINDCIKKYKVKKNKVHFLPFGSNIKNNYSQSDLINHINLKAKTKKCNLISIGVDWDRKGMSFACDVLKKLNYLNVPSELTIIGPKKIPFKYRNLSNLKVVKFLNKNKKNVNQKISSLLVKSHFHLLFSKSEAFGVVFAEANSFGLYNFTFDIGGIGGVVKDNINGFKFKKEISSTKVAQKIKIIFKNKSRYKKVSKDSMKYQNDQYNWKSISKKLKKNLI